MIKPTAFGLVVWLLTWLGSRAFERVLIENLTSPGFAWCSSSSAWGLARLSVNRDMEGVW